VAEPAFKPQTFLAPAAPSTAVLLMRTRDPGPLSGFLEPREDKNIPLRKYSFATFYQSPEIIELDFIHAI
jgi:hypothetical protein